HAAADRVVFDKLASELGLHGVLLAHPGCAAGMDIDYPRSNPQCSEFGRDDEVFITGHDIRIVFIAARWCFYADFSSCLGTIPNGSPADKARYSADQTDKRAYFPTMVSEVVGRLTAAGRTVWLIQPVPEYVRAVPIMMANEFMLGLPD